MLGGRRARVIAIALFVVVAVASALGYRHFYPPTRFDPESLTAYYTALRKPASSAVDDAAVRAAAAAATDYIRRANDHTGQFQYTVNSDPTVPVKRDYSILRHQGTVYSLGMVDDMFPDPNNVEVMRRAIGFMRDCCYVRDVAGREMIAIDEPDFIARGELGYYKLGGAGLGLLALTALERKSPGAVPYDEMREVSRFGEYLQTRSGAFYSLYSKSSQKRMALEKSLYYPGEMAMGWIALFELYPEDRAPFDSALSALAYLASTRARSGEAPADHWALLATARLFRAAEKANIEIPKEALINHALQICHTILEEARQPQPIQEMEGSLAPMGAVTPTATRLEGMLAALTFLPPEHPIVPHVHAAIDRGIDFLVRAQIKEGTYAGGLPMSISRLPNDGNPKTIKFNARATEIRIDYVQHSLSAMVQYLARNRSSFH